MRMPPWLPPGWSYEQRKFIKSPNLLEEGNELNFETWMHVFSSLLSTCTSSFQSLSSLSLCNERRTNTEKKRSLRVMQTTSLILGKSKSRSCSSLWNNSTHGVSSILLMGVLGNKGVSDGNYLRCRPYMNQNLVQELLRWFVFLEEILHW